MFDHRIKQEQTKAHSWQMARLEFEPKKSGWNLARPRLLHSLFQEDSEDREAQHRHSVNASRQSTLSLNMVVAQEYFIWVIIIVHLLRFLSWWEKTHPHPVGKPSPSQLGTSCLIKSRRYQAAQEKLVTDFLKLGVTIWLKTLIILSSAHWAENAWLVLKVQSHWWFLQFPELQLGSS